AICQRLGHGGGDDAADSVISRRLLHARGDIDGIAIDSDRSFAVSLLADDNLAAVDADTELWRDAKRRLISVTLLRDDGEHQVDGAQDRVIADCIVPGPRRDQTVAFVEINVAAVIDDRLRDVVQEFAHQVPYSQRAKFLAKRGRAVDVEKQQYYALPYRPMV